jgi:hypothetical protein
MFEKSLQATKIVHWPSGPVNSCDYHAESLRSLGNFMGTHIHVENAPAGLECKNCRNEIKEAV